MTLQEYGGKSVPSIQSDARAKPLRLETYTVAEYGALTWSTAQSVRDLFQNHLDAQTDKFFDRLVSQVLSNSEDLRSHLEENELLRKKYDDFFYYLYLYRKARESFSQADLQAFQSKLSKLARDVSLKSAYQTKGALDFSALDTDIAAIEEEKPKIWYQVKNRETQEQRWVTLEELCNDQKYGVIPEGQSNIGTDLPAFLWVINGVACIDEGMGYDPKLTAFYMSTKYGQRHLRGKFGEGGKLSNLHMLRNRASIILRSLYDYNENAESGGAAEKRRVLWQARPTQEQGTVQMRGLQVSMPKMASTGSRVVIKFGHTAPIFKLEMREAVDPRVPTRGLHENMLDYGATDFRYVVSSIPNNPILGISTQREGQVYVQGLRINGSIKNGSYSAAYSYDFVDSSILRGRDRSEVSNVCAETIHKYWSETSDVDLLTQCFRDILLTNRLDSAMERVGISFGVTINKSDQYAAAFTKLFTLQAGEKVILLNRYYADDLKTLQALAKLGIRVIPVDGSIVKEIPRYANKCLEQRNAHLYTVEDLSSLIAPESEELSEETEEYKKVEVILKGAWQRIDTMLGSERRQALEQKIDQISFVKPIKQSVITYDFDAKQLRHTLVISAGSMLKDYSVHNNMYWEMYIVAHLLALEEKNTEIADATEAMALSQEQVNKLLDNSFGSSVPDLFEIPEHFDHVRQVETVRELIARTRDRETGHERLFQYWMLVLKSRENLISTEQLEKLLDAVKEFPDSNTRFFLWKTLASRVVITAKRVNEETGDSQEEIEHVAYIEREATISEPKLHFVEKKLSDLPRVGEWDEHPIYSLDKQRMLVQLDIPDNSLVEYKRRKIVKHKGQLWDFFNDQFKAHPSGSSEIVILEGCVVLCFSIADQATYQAAVELLDELKISALESNGKPTMKQLADVVRTPLPVEYGVQEWDSPVRVFQDAHQNHLDALKPGQKHEELFEVLRDGQRKWIRKYHILEDDEITGYGVTDPANGYSPDRLGTMGFTSKTNPIFSGKYGEGSKLIAAAAARNGIELIYTSLANFENTPYRWSAKVGTEEEIVVTGGQQVKSQRVIFNQTASLADPKDTFVSGTFLRLPLEATEQQRTTWQNWLQVVDPRNTDQAGYGGMARYVRALRDELTEKNVIPMGLVKVLLDEPGCIYENGLLVTTEANTLVGYDVPMVVKTRERNVVDESKLRGYIAFVLAESMDSRLYQKVVDAYAMQFQEDDVDNHQLNKSSLLELKLNEVFDLAFWQAEGILSRPLWLQAQRHRFGNRVVHSDEYVQHLLIQKKQDLAVSSPALKPSYAREVHKLERALSLVAGLPKDDVVMISRDLFAKLQWFFETSLDLGQRLERQEIPVSEITMRQLQRTVALCAEVVSQLSPDQGALSEAQLRTIYGILVGPLPETSSSHMKYALEYEFRDARLWLDDSEYSPDQVFVAPAHAGYLGLADTKRIGLSELLLLPDNKGKLISTIQHELGHKLFRLGDYTVEFVLYLLLMLEKNKTLTTAPTKV